MIAPDAPPTNGMTSRPHPEKAGVILCQTWKDGEKAGAEYEMVWPPVRTVTAEVMGRETASDWELILAFNHSSHAPSLPKRLVNRIANLSWALQDGYGIPGYTPPQGWDWSGIRDSSDHAKESMAVAIRSALREAKVERFILDVQR